MRKRGEQKERGTKQSDTKVKRKERRQVENK
jgi:hypothetical protein